MTLKRFTAAEVVEHVARRSGLAAEQVKAVLLDDAGNAAMLVTDFEIVKWRMTAER